MPKTKTETEADLMELLRWCAKHIARRNMNGRLSDKFCLICTSTKVKRVACRHNEIWAVTRIDPLA